MTGLLRFAGGRAKESGKSKIIPKPRASAKLTHWGHLLEISAMPKSSMFAAAQEYDHIKYWRTQAKDDFLDEVKFASIQTWLKEKPGCSVHGRLPKDAWGPEHLQDIARDKNYADELKSAREKSKEHISNFFHFAKIALSAGGEVSFE